VNEKEKWICNRCDLELKPANANFTYLGHSFRAEVSRCPGCGQVFIPEELVKGRIAEVEAELEDK